MEGRTEFDCVVATADVGSHSNDHICSCMMQVDVDRVCADVEPLEP